MPYKHHPERVEYIHEEYPKMLVKTDSNGLLAPDKYPPGHAKQGLDIIFESKEEEDAYFAPPPKPKGKK